MSTTRQQALGDYGVLEYDLGDLLEVRRSGRCRKVSLRECPLCASDPTRKRYHFERGESRAKHFRGEH